MFRAKSPSTSTNSVQAQAPAVAAPSAMHDAWLDSALPEVVEYAPDEGWSLWKAAVQGKSAAEADTVLMDLLPA